MPIQYDVFLSYSRADSARVITLRDDLRHRGYRVFFDTESIEPGDQWKTRLDRAIRNSRTLILCWSANTRGSDYITFEYSRAEALHKPIYPWLLDKTPLPAMLEIQGVSHPDAFQVAAALAPRLGLTLSRRRALQSFGTALLIIISAIALWRGLHPPPPPPWIFAGEVTVSDKSRLPVGGVQVDLKGVSGLWQSTLTDSQGRYQFHLPQPEPKYVQVRFRKAGFEAEDPINVPTGKPCDMAMLRLP